MPELPEVETTLRGLAPVLQGRRIARLTTYRPDLRFAFPPDLAQRISGSMVTQLSRRAKYGLIHSDRGDVMLFHLGMSGRWRINPDQMGKHDHLLIETDSGDRLALNDPRRFGFVDLLRAEALHGYPAFAAMGPEPLGPDFDGAHLARALKGKKQAIKLALLDQRNVAGLGNIYVCEALHIAGISPFRAAGNIGKSRLDALAMAIQQVLERAIEAGGSTLRDYARPDGELGYFAHQWRVYGREDEPCPQGCGQVRRQNQGGRSTFWCPTCQR